VKTTSKHIGNALKEELSCCYLPQNLRHPDEEYSMFKDAEKRYFEIKWGDPNCEMCKKSW
jgi:hypothetical protein